VNPSEQEDYIARQVSEGAIAGIVPAPAAAFLVEQCLDASGVPGALGVIFEEGVSFLLVPAHFVLQLVDLAAGARLASIEAADVQEEEPACLLTLLIPIGGCHCRGSDHGMHAPIHAEHPLDLPQAGTGCIGRTASARSRTA
jgi:hypothetical protein